MPLKARRVLGKATDIVGTGGQYPPRDETDLLWNIVI